MTYGQRKPHLHAELIKAWADGAEIQYFSEVMNGWEDSVYPNWSKDIQYRIKPNPPLIRYARASCVEYDPNDYNCAIQNSADTRTYWTVKKGSDDNIVATFDSTTLKLLSVNLIGETK